MNRRTKAIRRVVDAIDKAFPLPELDDDRTDFMSELQQYVQAVRALEYLQTRRFNFYTVDAGLLIAALTFADSSKDVFAHVHGEVSMTSSLTGDWKRAFLQWRNRHRPRPPDITHEHEASAADLYALAQWPEPIHNVWYPDTNDTTKAAKTARSDPYLRRVYREIQARLRHARGLLALRRARKRADKQRRAGGQHRPKPSPRVDEWD